MTAILLNASAAVPATGQVLEFVQGNLGMLAAAIVLIVIAVLVIVFLKQIIVNSVLGLIAWALLYYVLGVKLNFWLSLIVSLVFGLAGIGVLLILKFFGVAV